jgi:hypothetical protein
MFLEMKNRADIYPLFVASMDDESIDKRFLKKAPN